MSQPVLKLNPDEEELFDVLRKVVAEYDLKTTIRVAGGWVRDKILGRESHDIDIALDNQSGETFARHVNKYLTDNGYNTRSIGVVKANPDRSKHLETATMKVLAHEVDFVNLRSETYTDQSRIPEIKMGTPYEDASRRDLTINAMFYNVTEQIVEDFTGQGLQDLENKIARTPLEPLTTFLDDPLRVMRTVRFATRFELELHPDTEEAMQHPEVVGALRYKISRERIGAELLGCLRGAAPLRALQLICGCGLYEAVFAPTGDTVNPQVTVDDINAMSAEGLALLEKANGPVLAYDGDSRVQYVISAFLYPWREYTCLNHKKRAVPAAKDIILVSLKLPAKLADIVHSIHKAIPASTSLMQGVRIGTTPGAVDIAAMVRSAGVHWGIAAQLASLIAPADDVCSYAEFREVVTQLKLDKAYEIRPLLKGQQIAKALGVKGAQIGEVVQRLLNWQFTRPDAGPGDAEEWLREYQAHAGST